MTPAHLRLTLGTPQQHQWREQYAGTADKFASGVNFFQAALREVLAVTATVRLRACMPGLLGARAHA